jgi:bacterioferritin-associated ferredoxin
MYVCICNGIKDKEVKTAVQAGAQTVAQVFKSQGCRPDCGKCFQCMRETIEEEMVQDSFALAAE